MGPPCQEGGTVVTVSERLGFKPRPSDGRVWLLRSYALSLRKVLSSSAEDLGLFLSGWPWGGGCPCELGSFGGAACRLPSLTHSLLSLVQVPLLCARHHLRQKPGQSAGIIPSPWLVVVLSDSQGRGLRAVRDGSGGSFANCSGLRV